MARGTQSGRARFSTRRGIFVAALLLFIVGALIGGRAHRTTLAGSASTIVPAIVLPADSTVITYVEAKDAADVLDYALMSPFYRSVCTACQGGEAADLGAFQANTQLDFQLTDNTTGGSWSSTDSTHARIEQLSGASWRIFWDDGGGSFGRPDGDYNDLIACVHTGGGCVNNTPPNANFTVSGEGGQILFFDGSSSSDPDGSIVNWHWDFGDGSTGSGVQTSHEYSFGEFVVLLTVTDNRGETNIYQQRVVAISIFTYAPIVYLHEGEDFWPMDQANFIQHSALYWAHDGVCRDERKKGLGNIDQYKLGSGGYYDKEKNAGCRDYGPRYYSNQYTRVNDDPFTTAKVNTETDEGFYLDLDNGYHRGNEPVVPYGEYTNAPILYFTYRLQRYIVYWFFYGFNEPANYQGIDRHEGDWERLAVRLDSNGHAIAVAYYQHGCDPTTTEGSLFTYQEMLNNGYLQGTHPIVYSANGSHASYPTTGTHSPGCAPLPELDKTSKTGPIWRTWEKGLAEDFVQDWYGYGGAWGDDELNTHLTGPLGPPHKDPVEFLPW